MKLLKMVFIVCFLCLQNAYSKNERKSYSDWVIFLNNSKLFNVEAGLTAAKKLIPEKNLNALDKSNQDHTSEHLPGYCIQSKNGAVKLTYLTGYLHDFDIIYGFELSQSTKNMKSCDVSKHLHAKVKTLEGISLGYSKEKVIAVLGEPTKKDGDVWEWLYEYHEVYPKPYKKNPQLDAKTGVFKADEWFAYKDEYHYGTIKMKFADKKLIWFFVLNGGEVGEVVKGKIK